MKRNRFKLKSITTCDLRLSVFRSNTNFYSQIINDRTTILAVSSIDKGLKKDIKNNGGNINAAKIVGSEMAKKANAAGIKSFFDRGGYLYHGRVKALQSLLEKKALFFRNIINGKRSKKYRK